MRKIILIFALMLSLHGFSQEEPFQKISQFDFQLKWNQARGRFDQTVGNIKYPFRFEATARLNRANLSVGMLFPLSGNTFITGMIGQEYHYETQEWNSLLGASFRSVFKYGIVRINYGSNWIDNHGVSSSLMYNLFGPFIRVGIATNNEYVGPRTEWQLSFGENSDKKIRVHVTYFPKEGRWDYGIRIRFRDWFPKVHAKLKEKEKQIKDTFKKT